MKVMSARSQRYVLGVLAMLVGLAGPGLAQSGGPTAYVTNRNSNSVWVIDTTTNTVVDVVAVGMLPQFIAITPDGDHAFVGNVGSNDVTVIDLATHAVDATFPVGLIPHAIDFTPDGVFAYVTNKDSDNVMVVNTATYAVVTTIPVVFRPAGVGIIPDGSTAYVANELANQISVIDTATQATVGGTIAVGSRPAWLAVEPDGSHVYIPLLGSNTVTILDTATDTVTGSVAVGSAPAAVVFRPDGAFAYASNSSSNTVSVIDTTLQSVVATVAVGGAPILPGVTPDGALLYVPNSADNTVSVVDTATNTVSAVLPVGANPWGVAVAAAHSALEFDQNVTNEVIFGSGNLNGGFTTDRNAGVELGLRGKVRFPVPMNVFNSNGDGTYTFDAGAHTGGEPLWAFEWSVNTDHDGSSGDYLADLTYELGLDFDPGAGTNYLAFDPITPNAVIPYTPPDANPFWDHAIGDNSTANGAGAVAPNAPTYAALLANDNLAQNSWRMDFFIAPPFTFDPTVPGQYEFYLAAFDGTGAEVARTNITVFALDANSLTLEAAPCQADQDLSKAGVQVAVELWMRNLAQDVTGFQAFLAFDEWKLTFEGASSSFSALPFPVHIQGMATANVAPGELRLDGNVGVGPPPVNADALLATLVFTVASECDPVSLAFDLTQPFDSELSFLGAPLVTALVDSSPIVPDATPPVVTVPADITVAADAGVGTGCDSAVVTYTASATDTCTGVTLVCTPPSGSAFPAGATTTVTCIATDDCGNVDIGAFGVTVTLTNKVSLDVQLVGVTTATTRCIRFVADDCGATADVSLPFDATGLFSGEIEVPCGNWTMLCAKDEQHTQWDTTTLSVSVDGLQYEADAVLALEGGDTDNDGDVDINDVTLFLSQFGSLSSSGGCPWDGVTRDADFDDGGAVGAMDYGFLTANWLTVSGCGCFGLLTNSENQGRAGLVSRLAVYSEAERGADLDRDGVIDWRDVELFELRRGLPHVLSARMRATTR
ncbi:MAG: hypothetical protein DRQ55_13780 [Planctomycetota bacterium]|nr:MAG: hypothetical protein DRQ55_13780 [Planctomycetota bacterium]